LEGIAIEGLLGAKASSLYGRAANQRVGEIDHFQLQLGRVEMAIKKERLLIDKTRSNLENQVDNKRRK